MSVNISIYMHTFLHATGRRPVPTMSLDDGLPRIDQRKTYMFPGCNIQPDFRESNRVYHPPTAQNFIKVYMS